jgi:hypothetical protein
MPEQNWQPQSSFQAPITPILVDPAAGTQVCAPKFAREWLPFIEGCLDQGRIPATFAYIDDATVELMREYVDKLKSILSMAAPCCDVTLRLEPNCVLQYSLDGGVTWIDVAGWADNFATCVRQAGIPDVPLLPPGSTPAQRACNISGYLASQVIKAAMQDAITAYNTNLTLLQFAEQVAASILAFEFPWTTAFLYAVYDFYVYFNAGNIAAFNYAMGDGSLWDYVACCFYNNIAVDGKVTRGNWPNVLSCICSITYVHPVVITAICAFLTALGVDGVLALQAPGVLDVVDCTGCPGPWCHTWNFRLAQPPEWTFDAGTWRSGYGEQGANGANTQLVVETNFVATYVSRLVITYSTEFTSGGAPREIDFYRAGVVVHQEFIPGGAAPQSGGGGVQDYAGIGVICDRIQVTIDSSYGGDTIFINDILIQGTGVSPFGPNNC